MIQDTEVRSRTIHTDGIDLVVDEAGIGGRPLLLVHGFTGCRTDWDPVVAPLAEAGWHVAAADNRGHGDSGHGPDEAGYSIEQITTDCFAVADELGWDSFVLLGHSLGGAVAQTMVLRHPERIEALILMDTTHKGLPMDPDLVGAAAHIARENGLAALAEAMRSVPDIVGGGPAYEAACARIPGYRERGEVNMLRMSPLAYAALVIEITTRDDHLDELTAITCPTLVLVGDEDEPFIKPSHRMAETIPGAQLVVIPGAGHSPQFENTDAWLGAVVPFLASLAPR